MNEDIASLEAAIESQQIEIQELYEESSDLRNRLENAVDRLRTAHFQEKAYLNKIERLTAERDEARRAVCRLHEGWGKWTAKDLAEIRGWDCYKEESK